MAEAAIRSTVPCDVVRVWPRTEPAAFRDGLSRLASGVAIVACQTPDGPRCLLATSLATISATPPRLLVCVEKASSAHDDLIKADALSVALLGADQRQDAESVGEAGLVATGFDTARWRLDPAAPPELREALAAFAGPIRCRIDAGAATLLVIDVSTARSRDGAPLVQFAGELRTLA